MTDIWQQPPADRPVQYVKFGPAPHQEIRAEVASVILTAWRGKDPRKFGEYLRDAMLDTNGHTP